MFKVIKIHKIVFFGFLSTINILADVALFALLLPLFFLFSGSLNIDADSFPLFNLILDQFNLSFNDQQTFRAALLAGMLILVSIKFVYSSWLNKAIIRYCQKIVIDVRESVITTFFHLDHHSLNNLSLSNFKNVILTESNFFFAFINAFVFLVSDFVFVGFLLTLLFMTMGSSSLILILLSFCFLLIFIFYYKTAISVSSRERTLSSEALTRISGEIFTNYESILVFDGVNAVIRDFSKAAVRFANASVDFLTYPVTFRLFIEGLLLIGLTLIMYFYNDKISSESFILLLGASVRTAPVFVRIFNSINSLLYYYSSIVAIQRDWVKDTNIESQNCASLNDFKSLNLFISDKGRYQLPLLAGKSFSFANNMHYVISGQSGCGKSTLLKMLLGFEVGYDCELMVDECNIDFHNRGALWGLIGYVPQNTYIYDASLYCNVTLDFDLNNVEANTPKVMNLINGLGLSSNNGFQYRLTDRLGEQGSLISGGQKQRICMARALFKNPEILVIDEGFSALDADTIVKARDFVKKYMLNGMIIEVSHEKGGTMPSDAIHIKL